MADEKTFTEAEVKKMIESEREKWVKNELEPLQEQSKKLMTDVKTKTEELFEKEKEIVLRDNDLADFKEFFNVKNMEELKEKVEKFKDVLKEKKIDHAYKPTDHKNTDKYSQYEKEGNTVGMIGQKLSSLLKK